MATLVVEPRPSFPHHSSLHVAIKLEVHGLLRGTLKDIRRADTLYQEKVLFDRNQSRTDIVSDIITHLPWAL